MSSWYLLSKDGPKGPVSSSTLKKLAEKGTIQPTTKVRQGTSETWVPASKVKGLFSKSVPPPIRQELHPSPPDSKPSTDPQTIPSRTEGTTPHTTEPGDLAERSGKRSAKSLIRSVPLGAYIAAAVFLLVGIVAVIATMRESPTSAYDEITTHAKARRWNDVWDRIDKKSQGRLEVTLEMLAGFASAFNSEAGDEITALRGKEIFLRMVESREDLSSRFIAHNVESAAVDGNRAQLKISRRDGDTVTYDTANMIWEDGKWKLSFEEWQPSESSLASSESRTMQESNLELHQETATTDTGSATVPDTQSPVQAASTPDTMPSVEPPSNPDVRNVTWGMPKDTVRKLETAIFLQDNDSTLIYEETIAGLECLLGYSFIDNKLVTLSYVVVESHTNNNSYLSDYDSIKDILTDRYGEPTEDKVIWSDDLYKDDPDHWGMAVATDRLTMFAKWRTDEHEITIGLWGDNFEISLRVDYESEKFRHLVEEKQKEERHKGL